MADVKKINGYNIKDVTARTNISTLDSQINTPSTGIDARLSAVESEINTPSTGLSARVGALETTIDTPETGLSDRVSDLESFESATNEKLNSLPDFDINTFVELDATDISVSSGTVREDASLHIASNQDKSICKIYGQIFIYNTTNVDEITVTINNVGLHPTQDININGACMVTIFDGNQDINDSLMTTYTVKTDGRIVIHRNRTSITTNEHYNFIACVLFMKNFGD